MSDNFIEVNNASGARSIAGKASSLRNCAHRAPLTVAAAHGPLFARIPAAVVCGARPLRLQVIAAF